MKYTAIIVVGVLALVSNFIGGFLKIMHWEFGFIDGNFLLIISGVLWAVAIGVLIYKVYLLLSKKAVDYKDF